MTIELAGGGYRVRVDPAHGAAVLSAEWSGLDGNPVPLLAPPPEPAKVLKGGCFPMLPFANRIDHGRFHFDGRDFELPVNLPGEDMAIHGFSRDHPWIVVGDASDAVLLSQDFEGNSYRYHARQDVRVAEDGIRMALSVRNDGARAMPFGIGLHPWFSRTEFTTLSFGAKGVFERDGRGLPVQPLRSMTFFDPDHPAPLGALPWFDGCFASWAPRRALIVWPEWNASLAIEADGAFRHLQVYAPDDREVVCAEPVSHLPDVINRPELGASCAMDILEPGATLEGVMTLRAAPHHHAEAST